MHSVESWSLQNLAGARRLSLPSRRVPPSSEPVDFGFAASRITGAPLVIVAVERGVPLMREVVYDHDEGIARLRETLERRGIHDPDIRTIDDRSASNGLAHAIDTMNPELLVLGASRRGETSSKLLGTTAQRVIHEAACPVAIVPVGYQPAEGGVRVIGAAYAPTDEGRQALRAAVTLARAGKARVVAISVEHPDHAAEQSHGLMAEQHHDVSPTEAEAGRARKGGEDELAAVIAELGRDVEIEADLLVNDPADGLIAARDASTCWSWARVLSARSARSCSEACRARWSPVPRARSWSSRAARRGKPMRCSPTPRRRRHSQAEFLQRDERRHHGR